MHRIIISFLTLFMSFNLWSQSPQISQNTRSLTAVEQVKMPMQDNKSLVEAELKARTKGRANKFAIAMKKKITPFTHGTWESTKENQEIWRIRIKSTAAHSINLGFTQFKLPKSGKMFLYNPDKSDIKGPFSKKDNEDHMQLWTPVIKGDELVIELQILAEEKEDLLLELNYINHDFIGIYNASVSGSCNVDVICGAADGFPEIDNYRDIIQSVGYYTLNGTDNCSGVLVNNTRQDCTPFYITAFHCGVNNSNAQSVVVYWNYENSYCREPNSADSGANGDGLKNQFNTGSTYRSGSDNSDFALLELDDPLDPNHNVFAAGWNRKNEVAPMAIAIHHPGLDEKRISFENDPVVWEHPELPNLNPPNDTSYVIINDWDLGTTEGGSSGSPLFNERKQVIGQLFGGLAACGNDFYDYYGWFGKSWEGDGTPETQLKHWLDPDGLDPITIEGINCSYVLSANEVNFEICTQSDDQIEVVLTSGGGFGAEVFYDVGTLPNGIAANFDNASAPLGESVTLVISGLTNLSNILEVITVTATDNINTTQLDLYIRSFNDVPETVNLITPLNNADNLFTSIFFDWAEANASSYTIQIASDENFNDVLIQSESDRTDFIFDNFVEGLSYYWRVNSNNPCGNSQWTEASKFTVGNLRCVEHQLYDFEIIIGEDPVTINNEFNINYDVELVDLNILNVQGEHSWVSDLRLSLTNPEGSLITFLNDICSGFPGFEDFNLGFDEQSNFIEIPCPPTDGKVYLPESDFTPIYFQSTLGTWDFIVEDTEFFDGGEVQNIELEFCFTRSINDALIPTKNYFFKCSDESLEFSLLGYGIDPTDINIFSNGIPLNFTAQKDPGDEKLGEITITDLSSLEEGINILNVTTANALVFAEIAVDIQITDIGVNLNYPMPEDSIFVDEITRFEFEVLAAANECIFDLSIDEDFATIIYSTVDNDGSFGFFEDLDPNETYYVRITCSNECGTSEHVFKFYTKSVTSVENNNLGTDEIFVFPNPASEKIFIQNNSGHSTQKTTLIDLLGRSIKSNSKNEMKIDDVIPGVYFLQLETSKKKYIEKIIVQ